MSVMLARQRVQKKENRISPKIQIQNKQDDLESNQPLGILPQINSETALSENNVIFNAQNDIKQETQIQEEKILQIPIQESISLNQKCDIPAEIEKEIQSSKTFSLEEGFTQLMHSAACGDINKVKELLEVEKRKQTKSGITALMCATCANQSEITKILVNEESKQQTKDGITALMIAISQGHLQIVENIMRQEFGVLDNNRRNCLMIAAMSGQYLCLKKLLEYLLKYQKRQKSKNKPIDVYFGARDAFGRTALRSAFECLQNANDLESEQLRMQILKNGLQCVNLLIEHEKDLPCEDNVTTLMLATKFGGTQFFDKLKGQCGEKDKNGLSAIHYAVLYNQKAFLELLIPEEIQQQDINGMTALMLAIQYDYQDLAELLEPQELEIRDFLGNTVLHYAAKYNRPELIKKYTEKFICSVNNDGETALMIACHAGAMEAVALLIQEVELTDNYGRTALMHAAMGGQVELVDVLLEAQGARVDNRGYTAACHACREDHPLVALKLLFEEQSQQDIHPIFVAVQFDAFKTIKAIADIARSGTTTLLSDQKFTFQEQQICLKQLKGVTHNFCGYPDGLDPLGLACYLQKDGAAFVLSFVGFSYNVLDASQAEGGSSCNSKMDGSFTTNDLKNGRTSRAISQTQKKGLGCGRKMRLSGYKLKNGFTQSISQQEPEVTQNGIDNNNEQIAGQGEISASLNNQKHELQPDVWTSLEASIKSSKGIRPSLGPSGITPLMLLAFQDCQISDITMQLICKEYSCLQLIQPFGGFGPGATALMIACAMKVDNLRLIEALVPFERDCVDAEGRTAVDYAKIGGRGEEVIQILL